MASREPSIRKAFAALKPCFGEYDFDHSNPEIICSIGWLTARLSVDTLRVELVGMKKDAAPPAEIASLVDETVAATSELNRAQAQMQRACASRLNRSKCSTASFDWTSAQDDVEAELGAWKPYGG